ncbi:MAG: flagellar basal body P-ring formation chaperone FlgA [Myxococcota bacterium]
MIFFCWLLSTFPAFAAPEADPIVEHISDAVQAHVAKDMNVDIEDVEVEWLGFNGPTRCEAEPAVWIDTRPGENYRGQTQIRVTLTDQTGVCDKMTLPSRVQLWKTVPVTKVDVESGDSIEVAYKKVSVTDIRGLLVKPDDGPWVANQPLRAGEPITMRFVRKEPAASVGDMVKLVVQYGPLTVTADARMLADAQIGESVRVSNLATNTVVNGILVASDRVRTGGER